VSAGREPLAECRHGCHEGDDVLAESPAVVDGPRAGVARRHFQIEVFRAARGQSLHDGMNERCGDAAPTSLGHDVEIRQAADGGIRAPRERESDGSAVGLRDECKAGVDDLPDLRELPPRVPVDVRRRGDFVLERAPEALQRRGVGRRGGADGHCMDATQGASGDAVLYLCFEEPGGGHPPRPSPAPSHSRSRRRSEAQSHAGTDSKALMTSNRSSNGS
jgi:hypothetical protein